MALLSSNSETRPDSRLCSTAVLQSSSRDTFKVKTGMKCVIYFFCLFKKRDLNLALVLEFLLLLSLLGLSYLMNKVVCGYRTSFLAFP